MAVCRGGDRDLLWSDVCLHGIWLCCHGCREQCFPGVLPGTWSDQDTVAAGGVGRLEDEFRAVGGGETEQVNAGPIGPCGCLVPDKPRPRDVPVDECALRGG